jgi:hypothetical protein
VRFQLKRCAGEEQLETQLRLLQSEHAALDEVARPLSAGDSPLDKATIVIRRLAAGAVLVALEVGGPCC